jgi:hypothetical protein
MNNKKAQVTMFVLMGLVLVFMLGIGLYLYNLESVSEVEQITFTEDRNPELIMVRSQIEFCLNSLTTQSLRLIGQNGGFIQPPQGLITNSFSPYSNNALNFFGSTIPYAHELTSSPSCINCNFRTNLPSLETGPNSIKNQVQQYIDSNLEECSQLQQFSDQMMITSGEPISEVFFDEQDTKTRVTWPINVLIYETNQNITEQYYDSVTDLKFKKLYETISEVLFQQLIQQNVLENYVVKVLQYISFSDQIPPTIQETRFTNTPTVYDLNLAYSLIKSELSENINLIQVIGSRDYVRPIDLMEPTQNLYEDFAIMLYADQFYLQDIKINFNYLDSWPTYINVNPSYGTVAMPTRNPIKIGPISTINRMEYDFSYDVTAPFLVEFEDSTAFGGQDPYLFRFPYEVNVRNTKPYNLTNNFVVQSTGFSDANQLTQQLTINTFDGYTSNPKPGVSVSYDCVDQSLALGVTQLQNGLASLTTSVPSCIGAAVQGIQEEYVSELVNVTSEQVNLNVYERKSITVGVEKRMLRPKTTIGEFEIPEYEWELTQEVGSFEQGEQVYIFLNLIINDEPSLIFQNATLSNENPTATFNLVPGNYQIILLSDLNLSQFYNGEKDYFETQLEIIEIRENGPLWGLLGGNVREDIPVQSQRFNESMMIGITAFEEDRLVTITPSNLISSNKMIIPYMAFDLNQVTYTRQLTVYGDLLESNEETANALSLKFE